MLCEVCFVLLNTNSNVCPREILEIGKEYNMLREGSMCCGTM